MARQDVPERNRFQVLGKNQQVVLAGTLKEMQEKNLQAPVEEPPTQISTLLKYNTNANLRK